MKNSYLARIACYVILYITIGNTAEGQYDILLLLTPTQTKITIDISTIERSLPFGLVAQNRQSMTMKSSNQKV